MKKFIFINLLCLFSISTFASVARVKISIKSGLSDVTVNAKSTPFLVEENSHGFVIKEVVIKTSELNVKPSMAAGKMKKKQFLNVEQYPEITVRSIDCDQETQQCTLSLKIKDKERQLLASYSGSERLTHLKFFIQLSEFDIAQSISLWKIENRAQVDVDILK